MKTRLEKLCIWFIVIILLFVACLLPYVSQNVFAVTPGDAVVYMDNAAKVQEVTSTFKKCVNMATTDSSVSALLFFGNYFTDGDMFGNSKTNMNTGAWLENTVQGKVDNGQIWCQNDNSNIAKVFANTIGVSSWQNLVCNGDKPGIMTLQVYTLVNSEKNIYQWKNTDSACSIGFGNGDYKFAWRSNADAMAYIKQLYENYKSSNPEVAKYLPAWDDLGNFSDKRVAYFSYLNDFKTACTDGTVYSGDLSLMNQGNYFPPIKEVNPSTGVLEDVYYKKNISKNNWDNSIVGSSGAHTCDTVIAKINEYADIVAQEAGAIVEETIKEAEEAARERSKERCKALALYASVEFDGDGNIINKTGVGDEPSAAYYYIKAKKIVDSPDATRADIVKQLRESLVANNPGLSDDEIDAKIDEQKSQIDDTLNALLKRAQSIYDKFDKVLNGAGTGTGDGNPETSYWYENSKGEIVCTEFESFDDTISNDSGYQDILDKLLNNATSSTNPTPTAPTTDIDECQSTAGSLGWILCPVLRIMSENVDRIYDDFVQKQFLEIDATSLDPNDPSGQRVYAAWGAIRNTANVMFVILFMIVVFSQLTGFGLTNYGIKKMLPKLIIISVLVNISFLLCQFAVDLSNVLGYTMNNLFDSLGGTVSGLGGSFNSANTAVNWITTLGLAIAASTAGSWLPVFLLTLLSAAISVFFGALILGARKAGIYILIVLAPAAIVCYALPNAKKMFDRWFKIFTALLVVFPICGALMGGGNFASYILLGSGGFFLTLVAMLLRVVPFFMIPGLVRSAMSAMGNVGTKISGIGSRLGGTATDTVRKSDGFQRGSEFVERNLRGRPRMLVNKGLRKIPKVGSFLTRGSDRRIAGMVGKQEARLRGDQKAAAIAGGGFISRQRMKDMDAAAIEAEENRGIDEAASGYKAKMDTGNAVDVSRELEARLNELQAKPGSVEVRRRVKALTKILLESDDGRGALTEATQKFAEAHPTSEATKELGKYLGNSENMGKIKGSNQRGLQELVKNINKGQAIQSLAQYGAAGAGKIGAGAVGGLDESFLKAQVAAARSGALSGPELQKFADTYTRALTSENAANEIPPKLVDYLNEIRAFANPVSKPLQPGDTLPIPHATMPAGWRYDNSTQRWVNGHGAALSRENAIKAEEIAKHNARADIK